VSYQDAVARRVAEGETDLGSGVTMAWLTSGGERIGLIETHEGTDGKECPGGLVHFDVEHNAHIPEGHRWTVESWEPLTISPSLLCNICQHHGFIRHGRWVVA
jgi:hypothetical protein